MALTTLLLMLRLTAVFVEPENPAIQDDQILARCAGDAMTAKPSELRLVRSKDLADVVLTVGNHAAARIHVIGTLTKPDGTVLITVNHVTHGLNHSLCHQADGLLDEMTRKLVGKEHAASH